MFDLSNWELSLGTKTVKRHDPEDSKGIASTPLYRSLSKHEITLLTSSYVYSLDEAAHEK